MQVSPKIIFLFLLFIIFLAISNLLEISPIIWSLFAIIIALLYVIGAIPIVKNRFGTKLAQDIYFQFDGPQDVLVSVHDKKLSIYVERSAVRGGKVVRVEDPTNQVKNYMAPHETEQVDAEVYKRIIDLLCKYYKQRGYKVTFT